jgi:hypothetical protein
MPDEHTNFSMMFPRKGYGRIYVAKEEDIEKVKNIIREIDKYEFEYYFPRDLIAVFDGKIESEYTHKFCDLDMTKVLEKAWQQGIYCFCYFGVASPADLID